MQLPFLVQGRMHGNKSETYCDPRHKYLIPLLIVKLTQKDGAVRRIYGKSINFPITVYHVLINKSTSTRKKGDSFNYLFKVAHADEFMREIEEKGENATFLKDLTADADSMCPFKHTYGPKAVYLGVNLLASPLINLRNV